MYTARSWAATLGLTPNDVALGGYEERGSRIIMAVLPPLLAGAHVVAGVVPGRGWTRIADTVWTEGITVMPSVPAMLALVIRDSTAAGISELPGLRALAMGSAPPPPALVDPVRAFLPSVGVWNCYGASEGAVSTCPPEYFQTKTGSVGRAFPGSQIAVLDDYGRPVPTGETGRVAVRGPGTTIGYWRNPEETAAAMADGWVFPGDLGHLDGDGLLWLDGRLGEVINGGGWKVLASEVEAAIATLPEAQHVAVVGRPDRVSGETVVAYVQPFPGTDLTRGRGAGGMLRPRQLQTAATHRDPGCSPGERQLPRSEAPH